MVVVKGITVLLLCLALAGFVFLVAGCGGGGGGSSLDLVWTLTASLDGGSTERSLDGLFNDVVWGDDGKSVTIYLDYSQTAVNLVLRALPEPDGYEVSGGGGQVIAEAVPDLGGHPLVWITISSPQSDYSETITVKAKVGSDSDTYKIKVIYDSGITD